MSRKKVEDYAVVSISLYQSDFEKLESLQKASDLSRSGAVRELIRKSYKSKKGLKKGGAK